MSVEYFNRVRIEMNQTLWDGVDDRGLTNEARISALRIFFREMVRAFEARNGEDYKAKNLLTPLELGTIFFGLGWLEEHGGTSDGYEPTLELETYDGERGVEVGARLELADLAFEDRLQDLLKAGAAKGYRHSQYVLMLEALPEMTMDKLVGVIIMTLASGINSDPVSVGERLPAGNRRAVRGGNGDSAWYHMGHE